MNYFSLYLKGLICFCLLFITMDIQMALIVQWSFFENPNNAQNISMVFR